MNPFSGYFKVGIWIVVAVAFAFACVKIYDFGFHNAEVIGEKNLGDYKATLNSDAASSVAAAFADYASGVARGQAAESKFFIDQHADDVKSDAMKTEIDHVAQPHIAASVHAVAPSSASAADPVYRCVFSRGFVRLWNAAVGADDPDAAVSAGADSGSTAFAAGSGEAADSGVSQRDILDWLVDYASGRRTAERKLSEIRGLQQPASAASGAQ